MPSVTVENYLKTIFTEQQRQRRETGSDALLPMGQLAAAMNVSPGTVTSMIKTLADSALVRYEPREGVELSETGESLALHVVRRHRLVELFLVQMLGLDWAEVHQEAEELEHAISDKVLDRIDELLGYPRVDPHGDPIPTSSGKLVDPARQSLASCPLLQPMRIARVVDQDPEFLSFVVRSGLKPGVEFAVSERDSSAASVTLELAGKNALTIGTEAAEKILVESVS